jgi:hypothetical protein
VEDTTMITETDTTTTREDKTTTINITEVIMTTLTVTKETLIWMQLSFMHLET